MLALCLYCSTAALTTPQIVLSTWWLVELRMLDFSDCTRTGISILTSANSLPNQMFHIFVAWKILQSELERVTLCQSKFWRVKHNTKTKVFRLKPILNCFSVKQACTKMWNLWSGCWSYFWQCLFVYEKCSIFFSNNVSIQNIFAWPLVPDQMFLIFVAWKNCKSKLGGVKQRRSKL